MNFTRTILCRWQPQASKLVKCPTITFSTQHLKSPRQQSIFRSIRTSAKKENSLQATPFEKAGPIPPSNVIKAAMFTGAFTVGAFLGATVLEYEMARAMMYDKVRHANFSWLQRKNMSKNSWEELKTTIKYHWDNLSKGEKVFVPLCALNFIVYGLWRVPSMRNTMMIYFTSNPAARAICWPMFLSTFSHYNFLHLAANMYVLHSFSNAAVISLGKEQFLGLYLSAGVIASLTSVMYKAAIAQAGLSIGASGAIMAILAYVCTQYPDTRLSILFLPTLTFGAGTAIKVIMGLDFAGCVLGWKFFDHAAHLGGAVFGVFWAYFGNELWQQRLPFLQFYHDLRKTK